MKIFKTANFEKLEKCKGKDFDEMKYNPAAVCSENIDKEEEPAKWRRCVEHVKEKQTSSETEEIKEAKKEEKWMQDAVKEPGSFTEYCGGKVTEECISKGKKSPNKKTRQRANLADTFRNISKKK